MIAIIKYNDKKMGDLDKLTAQIYKVLCWINKRYLNLSIDGVKNEYIEDDFVQRKCSIIIYFKENQLTK